MSDGDVFSISAVYESTGNGVTAANTLYIYVYATEIDGVVERTATLYSASTVGQLTATDVDRGTVFRYESVGAPLMVYLSMRQPDPGALTHHDRIKI